MRQRCNWILSRFHSKNHPLYPQYALCQSLWIYYGQVTNQLRILWSLDIEAMSASRTNGNLNCRRHLTTSFIFSTSSIFSSSLSIYLRFCFVLNFAKAVYLLISIAFKEVQIQIIKVGGYLSMSFNDLVQQKCYLCCVHQTINDKEGVPCTYFPW